MLLLLTQLIEIVSNEYVYQNLKMILISNAISFFFKFKYHTSFIYLEEKASVSDEWFINLLHRCRICKTKNLRSNCSAIHCL